MAFPITSRYYSTGSAQIELPDGTPVNYLQRRFVPPPETFSLLQEHSVTQDERLDHIAAQYLGDPGAVLAHLRRQQRNSSRRVDRNHRPPAAHYAARRRYRGYP